MTNDHPLASPYDQGVEPARRPRRTNWLRRLLNRLGR